MRPTSFAADAVLVSWACARGMTDSAMLSAKSRSFKLMVVTCLITTTNNKINPVLNRPSSKVVAMVCALQCT